MPRALVTGPTSGIGRCFAVVLAADGYDLVLVARDAERLAALAGDLTALHGVAIEVLVADLSDLEQTRTVERRLARDDIDLLVNNAGYGLRLPFDATDVETEEANLDVLVRAVMRLTHAALGPMLARGSGDIVNVSSVAGFLPRGTYGANKAWVTSFSAWANVRYAKQGVRILALCPGFTRTEFHQRMDASMKGIPSFMWLDADRVVREGLRDLRRGRAISIPSRRYRALITASRLVPRPLMERLSRRGR